MCVDLPLTWVPVAASSTATHLRALVSTEVAAADPQLRWSRSGTGSAYRCKSPASTSTPPDLSDGHICVRGVKGVRGGMNM